MYFECFGHRYEWILYEYFICWKNENIKYDILMKFLWIFHVHQDSIKIWKFHKNIIWNSWTAFAGFSYHITNRAQNRIHPRWPLLAAPPRASNGKPSSSPIPCPHPSSIPTPSNFMLNKISCNNKNWYEKISANSVNFHILLIFFHIKLLVAWK